MANRVFLIALMIISTAIAPSLAADYKVGDNSGWTFKVDYTKWAEGKEFYVGDRLIFTYNKDIHNVAKANMTQFQQCSTPELDDKTNILNTGNDTITLGTAGKKWYLCSISDHCTQGMKLVINVMPAKVPAAWAPAPSPADNSATDSVSPLKSYAWVLATLTAFIMFFT